MRWQILIVEDDKPFREALSDAFSFNGHVVHQAEHGARALELLGGGCRPGIILLDMIMPVMDGIRFLDAKAAAPAIAGIPVVMMSATEPDLLPGAACFVRKPFDQAELERLIERYHSPVEAAQ